MYFEIENTPERIKKSRQTAEHVKQSPKDEYPRLTLAPFNKPPQVVFDNVMIGASCERELEVFNPLKQTQQITLEKSLPPGLEIQWLGEWLELEPETCYCLSLKWTPLQPTASREVIHFTNDQRRRFDVIMVLKSCMNVKSKTSQSKGLKISPGKIRKKVIKKSPIAINKKKAEIIYTTTKIMKTVNVQTSQSKNFRVSNKENFIDSSQDRCPFGSPASADFTFNTPEIFSKPSKNNLQDTYDTSYTPNIMRPNFNHQNVLKPSNKQFDSLSTTDLFDNLTFTPLKTVPTKAEKLEKGPKVVVSIQSESDFDDSLEGHSKENKTHSIVCITSTQSNKWLTINQQTQINSQYIESPSLQNKKHPDTSSPKELNSPNFSINTDFSRISDSSFFPSKFSTEKKCFPKFTNDAHEIINEIKMSTDTFTKESPNTRPMNSSNLNQFTDQRPNFDIRENNQKYCRQSLFKEHQPQREYYENYFTSRDPNTKRYQQTENCDRYYSNALDHNHWENCYKMELKSPPRSVTPPLQSIPEESYPFSDTQSLYKTGRLADTFTINRTFDKTSCSSSASKNKQLWSKKAIRVQANLWKKPEPCRNTPNATNAGIENNDQSVLVNKVGNVYSESFTVDPFTSKSYYYDEKAVNNMEKEFKKWLNYILTPPADLESNLDQKIDVGKAWIENRNKEIPLAPTKEQVSSVYHNNHRLESLRRAARSLLRSAEIVQVIQKLNAQIEKKLIAMRTDRNLHLDVGLQKMIMELLLSYNPLWLRMGLEAIYGHIIPLKSNSDIEGLTTFIIQRMFKNPYLKNKHSKSSAPNVLLPAYMDAIKKFTLKKFFMLIFFLDQAKQKKLISHDPCLFCRNAVSKESREIIIRFTREVIAGIGDITKHLRPLGYVVCHKQSYLDEYKYAVNNIAADIKDGVRLTKVMEIILMRNGLLNQLRTPAISRLQKIHNVQVALNALKEANFTIVGEITANDIADGHREKTLSLLWQIIHEFRAPLFEKASNTIQTWWRKIYAVILQKRRQEEEIREKFNVAASRIQCWWRRITYNRLVQLETEKITKATITLQKYCRMWLCRRKMRKLKKSVTLIGNWYKSVKLEKEAKACLNKLRLDREVLRKNSAIILQSYVRRWLCMKQYKIQLRKIIVVQSTIRCHLERSKYNRLKTSAIYIQQKFRSVQIMKLQKKKFDEFKRCAILIQRKFRSYLIAKSQRKVFVALRIATIVLQKWYRNVLLMKKERSAFLKLKNSVTTIQRYYRAEITMRICRENYASYRAAIITIQRRYRAHEQMRRCRTEFLKLKSASFVIQNAYRAYSIGKRQRQIYLTIKTSATKIQHWYRNCKKGKGIKQAFEMTKRACVIIQQTYRSYVITKKQRQEYIRLRSATICIQQYYRSYVETKIIRKEFIRLKSSVIVIQRFYISHLETKKIMGNYIRMKAAASFIANYYKRYKEATRIKDNYLELRRVALNIQKRFKSLLLMRVQRQHYLKMRQSAVYIQSKYRALLAMRKQRQAYLVLRSAVITIQERYRANVLMKLEQAKYNTILKACISIQIRYRAFLEMKNHRQRYLKLKETVVIIQRRYRALLQMRRERDSYLKTRAAAKVLQTKYRGRCQMIQERQRYKKVREACIKIQRFYRAYKIGKKLRIDYYNIKKAATLIQRKYRLLIECRKIRNEYLKVREATIFLQKRIRANKLNRLLRQNEAAKKIQSWYVAIKRRNECRITYLKVIKSVVTIQAIYRMFNARRNYIKLLKATTIIQVNYRSYKLMLTERRVFVVKRLSIIKLQSRMRAYAQRKKYLRLRAAVMTIQSAYRRKRYNDLMMKRKVAAICIQKNVRRYLAKSRYTNYRCKVIFIQTIWRSKLLTRLIRCAFLQKRNIILRFQAVLRGFLARKNFQHKREFLIKVREQQIMTRAATKIQALFRGHRARLALDNNHFEVLRQRLRDPAVHTNQETSRERSDRAIAVLGNSYDIETVINAFRQLEYSSSINPMIFDNNASSVVRRVYNYMYGTNRSISSIELLMSAAALLVNLARYKVTGPKIYERDRMPLILKFLLRFSNSETALFTILVTYLWLFAKYDDAKNDLTAFLHIPENHKLMITIKGNVARLKRMSSNTTKNRLSNTNRTLRFMSNTTNQNLLPALEPDYNGVIKTNKPQYFIDAQQAINCLFNTYSL